jgi:hypothetical protein
VWRPAGVLAVLGLLLCGCVGFLPLPTTKYTPREYGTRGEIESSVLRFLKTGTATRIEVLLNLGEPDLRWGADRYFAYRWITARGRVVAWGVSDTDAEAGSAPISKRRHDLVIEFDGRGTVRRYGDIRKWKRNRDTRSPALELAGAATIDVVHRLPQAAGGPTGGRLRLGESLSLERAGDRGSAIRIRVGDVRRFHYQSKKDVDWKPGTFHCRLKYRDGSGRLAVLELDIGLTDLPLLIDYLRTRCPGARITS